MIFDLVICKRLFVCTVHSQLSANCASIFRNSQQELPSFLDLINFQSSVGQIIPIMRLLPFYMSLNHNLYESAYLFPNGLL